MTRPPENATASAEASPVRAPWVVRTLALVATVIPMNPAKAEQSAPVTNDTATSGDDCSLVRFTATSSAATATTKTASTRYLPAQKGSGALRDGRGNLCHPLVASILPSDPASTQKRVAQGQQPRDRNEIGDEQRIHIVILSLNAEA